MDNKVNFTGVIPVKVHINGTPSTEPRHIRQACNRVVKLMAGPADFKHKEFYKQLATMDNEYSLNRALRGYCHNYRDGYGRVISEKPSDYFKTIFNLSNDRGYITTGQDSVDISIIGKRIGIAKLRCNESGFVESCEHRDTLSRYKELVNGIINDLKRRVTASVQEDLFTTKKKPVTLNIYATAKPGKDPLKDLYKDMKIDNLQFTVD